MPANHRLLFSTIIFLLSSPAYAEQEKEQPSEELLEFLGQWEKVDGKWLDPTQLQEISMLDKKSMKGEADDK